MSEAREMLERIRTGALLEAGLGTGLSSEQAAEAFASVIGPIATDDFYCLMDGGAMVARHEGVEGLRTGWIDLLSAFETVAVTPGEVLDGADGRCVVEFVRLTGRPKGIDAEIEQDAAAVWRLRDDKLAAVEFFMDRARALRAGGLEP